MPRLARWQEGRRLKVLTEARYLPCLTICPFPFPCVEGLVAGRGCIERSSGSRGLGCPVGERVDETYRYLAVKLQQRGENLTSSLDAFACLPGRCIHADDAKMAPGPRGSQQSEPLVPKVALRICNVSPMCTVSSEEPVSANSPCEAKRGGARAVLGRWQLHMGLTASKPKGSTRSPVPCAVAAGEP